eukprot:SAG31_NODE_390_length_16345_cov_12.811523_1_plen_88_part_10
MDDQDLEDLGLPAEVSSRGLGAGPLAASSRAAQPLFILLSSFFFFLSSFFFFLSSFFFLLSSFFFLLSSSFLPGSLLQLWSLVVPLQ